MSREIVILLIFVVLIIGILYAEYVAHDCVEYKTCTHTAPLPDENDPVDVYLEKIRYAVRNNYNFVAWRQALLVAIVLTPILVYLLLSRLPTLIEWIVVIFIIFIGVYLSSSWMWNRFLYPNGKKIEKALEELKIRTLSQQ